MEVVLVTRGQPGPALWRVTSGHHTLWILGEVSPLWSRIDMQAFELAGMLTSARYVRDARSGA